MDFEFSPEQEMLRASVRAFLAAKAPLSSVRERYESDRFDDAVWRGLATLDVFELGGILTIDDSGPQAQ